MGRIKIPLEVLCESDNQHYLVDDPNIIQCNTDNLYYLRTDDNIVYCETDGLYYLEDDSNIVQCSSNNLFYLDDDDSIIYIESDRGYYLKDDNDIFLCDDCNQWFLRRDAVDIHNGLICQHCHERGDYSRCEDCEGIFHIDNLYYMENLDISVCNSCYSDYDYCDNCGSYYRGGDGCDCDDSEKIDDRIIHTYSYKPDPLFFRNNENKHKPLYLGVELETENFGNKSINDMAREVINVYDSFYYLKEDGSINNGFEVVTHPFSFNWYRKNKNTFTKMLSALRDNKFRSYQSGNCGLHIHLTRNYFSSLELYKIVKFFESEKHFITSLSQRNNGSTHYCAKNIDNPKYIAKNKYGSDRYRECNLTNDYTIEFRFFRGTTNEAGFLKAIEFCFSFADYVKQVPLNNINKYSFYQFILINKKTYKNLIAFIERRQLCVL